MTIYAGEYLRIGVSIKGQVQPGRFERLTSEDLESAKISIWGDGRAVVVEQDLDYDPEIKLWIFFWDTAGCSPGKYEFRCTFYGEGERRTWEEGFVTLHRSNRPLVVVTV